jgi:hypothetical protein
MAGMLTGALVECRHCKLFLLQAVCQRLSVKLCCCCCAVQADNEQLEVSLAAANIQVAKLQQQLNSLNELQQGLQASLEGKQSAEASLMAQLTQVRCWQGSVYMAEHVTAVLTPIMAACSVHTLSR